MLKKATHKDHENTSMQSDICGQMNAQTQRETSFLSGRLNSEKTFKHLGNIYINLKLKFEF